MPDSKFHCGNCEFNQVSQGTRPQLAMEHTLTMDYIHGHKSSARGLAEKKKNEGEDISRLDAALDCARQIVAGECELYIVKPRLGSSELQER
jgi:hypothetical protein